MHFVSTALLALSALAPAIASAIPTKPGLFPKHCFPDPCKGITFQNETYVCGDPRLGPVKTPSNFPLNTELRTYARFGSLCPAEFLDKWATSIAPNGSYIYPPDGGFLVDDTDSPIRGNVTLSVGQKLDRFGSEYGKYLGTLGAPYIERALPPNNLITYDGKYPFNYYVYEVTKEFQASVGTIAPWFEQPGLGTQILTETNVLGLIQGGYLKRLVPSEYDERVEYSNDYTPGPEEA